MLNHDEVMERAIRWGVIAEYSEMSGDNRTPVSFSKLNTYLDVLDIPYSGKDKLTRDLVRAYALTLAAVFFNSRESEKYLATFMTEHIRLDEDEMRIYLAENQ